MSLPVWLIGSSVAFSYSKAKCLLAKTRQEHGISPVLVAVPLLAIIVLLGAMAFVTQEEQNNKWTIEEAYSEDRDLLRCVKALSSYERNELPPYYMPPPRMIHLFRSSFIEDMKNVLAYLKTNRDKNVWVYDYYREIVVKSMRERPRMYWDDRGDDAKNTQLTIDLFNILGDDLDVPEAFVEELTHAVEYIGEDNMPRKKMMTQLLQRVQRSS